MPPGRRTLGRRIHVGTGLRQVAAISSSLVGTQAVTSVLGLGYWTIAARQASVASVGVAAAAVSLMLLLGSLGMLGLGTLLMAELPRLPQADRRLVVRTALASAGIASGALGGVAAVVIGLFDLPSLHTIAVPLNAVDFAVGTGLTGLTMVLDQAVLVVGRSRVQLERNTLASVVKIVALLALGTVGRLDGMEIFLAWTIGNLVSLLLVVVRTRRSRLSGEGLRRRGARLIDPAVVRRMARSAASHHALNLMLQAPLLLLSLVVAIVLTAEANGYFSTARSVAGFVFVLPFSVTIALFAASAGREFELVQRLRFTIPIGLGASLLADVVLFPFGSTVLHLFGGSYAAQALTTLRVLALAGIPFVIKDHFVALRRVQNRTGNAAMFALVGAVVELVAAVIGARVGGTVGLCLFWVGALTVEAAVLSVPLVRAARGASRTDGMRTDRTLTKIVGPFLRPIRTPIATPPARRSHTLTGPLVFLMSVGLVVGALAVRRGRAGDVGAATQALFWIGLLLIFVPAAARIVGSRAPTGERVALSLALALLLQLSRTVLYPTTFAFHDEFIHANTLRQLVGSHHLFTTNPLLPVSAYYPGLEIVTDAVHDLSGLSQHVSAIVVLVLARAVTTLGVVGVVARITRSTRTGCVASLIYTCNPQGVFFNSQYSYQSLALPLLIFAAYVLATRDRTAPLRHSLALPLAVAAAITVTHHLTSMILVAALVGWLLLVSTVRRLRHGGETRALATMSVATAAMVVGWAALPGNPVGSYLRTIAVSSVSDVRDRLSGHDTHRLFQTSAGLSSPLWERAATVASIAIILVAVLSSALVVRRWLNGGESLLVLLGCAALVYPIIPLGHLAPGTGEVTDRASGFLFLGIGLVISAGLAFRVRPTVRYLVPVRTVLLAVVFAGGVVLGAGPTAGQLPGPYLVSADARSIDAANLAAAWWERAHLPPGTRVYADRDSGLLAAAVGGLHTVTHIADGIDASRILLAPRFTAADRRLIRAAGIEYVIVDQRDSTSLPSQQVYIESGEYGSEDRTDPVTARALHKLASVPGVQRVYSNGPLVIYDVRALDGR